MGGRIVLTVGVSQLGPAGVLEVLGAVTRFDAFNADNDPWGEHDCAVLTVGGRSIIFKIDYYDPTMTAGSEDPANPHATVRVLTIMLAEEY